MRLIFLFLSVFFFINNYSLKCESVDFSFSGKIDFVNQNNFALIPDLPHSPKLLKNKTFLLSFPRSGRNWTVGILQAFFKRPVEPTGRFGKNRLSINLEGEPIVYITHQVEHLKEIVQKNNNLILLLRNYKECITSHRKLTESLFVSNLLNSKHAFMERYVNVLKLYDEWEGKKLLIFYEDLISDPLKNILKIVNFFDDKLKLKPEEFFKNYDYYRSTVYNSYSNQWGYKFRSDGFSAIHHSKNFSENNHIIIDKFIMESYPYLWDKYLKRYEYK